MRPYGAIFLRKAFHETFHEFAFLERCVHGKLQQRTVLLAHFTPESIERPRTLYFFSVVLDLLFISWDQNLAFHQKSMIHRDFLPLSCSEHFLSNLT